MHTNFKFGLDKLKEKNIRRKENFTIFVYSLFPIILGVVTTKMNINRDTIYFYIFTSSVTYLLYLISLLKFNKYQKILKKDIYIYLLFTIAFLILSFICFYIGYDNLYNFLLNNFNIDIDYYKKYLLVLFVSIYSWIFSTLIYLILKLFIYISVRYFATKDNYTSLVSMVRNGLIYDIKEIKKVNINMNAVNDNLLFKIRFEEAEKICNELDEFLNDNSDSMKITDYDLNKQIFKVKEAYYLLKNVKEYVGAKQKYF